MQFVERQETASHSLCIVVFAKHTEGTETTTDVALSPHVSPPESSEELTEFHMVYGDSYVVSPTTGGKYMAVYTYHCDTAEEQQEVSVAMEAGGIFKAFVVDVGLQAQINEFRSNQSTRISFNQLLTGIRQVEGGLPDPDYVIDFALNFPSLPLTATVITQLKTRGYERVAGIGSRFNGIARNVRLLTQQSFIDGLIRVKDLRAQVHSVVGAYSLYAPAVGAADAKLQELVAVVDADGRAIEAMVEGFEEDPSKPVELELVSIERGRLIGEPMIGFYERKQAIGEAPSSGIGYTRVEDFDDMGGDVYRFLKQRSRITAFSFLNGPRRKRR
ncbi:hypothetical protein L7F22_060108 [Adiantum nelumboides]|nr:hypothetical protein [Adiantum nelumboides]